MTYINVETGQYPVLTSEIYQQFPDTSFPAELQYFNETVLDFGYAPVVPTAPPVTSFDETVEEAEPLLIDGSYVQQWNLRAATDEELDQRYEQKAEEVRNKRNQLLADSDWTQIPDAVSAGADQRQWSEYRQQLREITSQPGFPWNVTWPQQPDVVPPSGRIDYRLFYDNLIASPIYMVIRQKAVTDVVMLTACVEFIAAISDAKSGRPNVAAIQTCINLLCAAAQFTPQERDMLAEAMEVGGMDRIYTLP